MTEAGMQTVTKYVRGLFVVGMVVLLGLMVLLFWRKSNSISVGEVTVAAPLTFEDAQQKIWFSLPRLAPREGWQEDGIYLVNDKWAVIRYSAAAGSIALGKGTKRPLLSLSRPYPREARKTTTVNGNLAIFVQGGWDDNNQWNTSMDTALLEWTSNGFHYRIQHTGLGLNYQQMINLGESLIVKPEKAAATAIAVESTADPA